MTTWLTLPFLGASAAVFKFGSDFETELSKIEGLVGVSRQQIDAWKTDLQDMAGVVGKGPEELAEGLFFVTSAGFRGAEAMDVLDKAARASAAGLGETKTVADLVTSAVNAYGAANLDAGQATDVLVAAVREGKAEAPELAASMGQVLPIASELGVSFDQVGAAVAAMTRTGTDASTASIQLRQILASLLKPTADAEQAMEEMGTSSAGLRRTLREEGLVGVLGFLRRQMDENEQAMSRVFPNIRALSGALDIMGGNAAENVQIFDRMTDTTGSLEKAFAAADRTGRQGLNQLLAEIKSTATVLYEDGIKLLIGGFGDLQEGIARFRRAWGELSSEAKAQIFGIVGLLVASGPMMMAFGKLIQVVAGMASFVFSKFGLMAAGVGLIVVAGQNLIDNWDLVVAKFKAHWLEMQNIALTGAEGILFVTSKAAPFEAMALQATADLEIVRNSMEHLEFEARNNALQIAQLEDRHVSFAESAGNAWTLLKGTVMNLLGTAFEGSGLDQLLDLMKQKLDTTIESTKQGASTMSAELSETFAFMQNLLSGQLFPSIQQTSSALSEAGAEGEASFDRMAGAVGGLVGQLLSGKKEAMSFGSILSSLVPALISAIPGAGALGGFASALFGGFRQHGGPVSSGRSYVVGEGGPEIFSPNTSGMIIPGGRMATNRQRVRVDITGTLTGSGSELRAVINESKFIDL